MSESYVDQRSWNLDRKSLRDLSWDTVMGIEDADTPVYITLPSGDVFDVQVGYDSDDGIELYFSGPKGQRATLFTTDAEGNELDEEDFVLNLYPFS